MPPSYRPHSLLTFARAAEVLGLTRWQVRAMADDGRLPTYRIPGDAKRIRRIRYGDLVACLRQIEASQMRGREAAGRT